METQTELSWIDNRDANIVISFGRVSPGDAVFSKKFQCLFTYLGHGGGRPAALVDSSATARAKPACWNASQTTAARTRTAGVDPLRELAITLGTKVTSLVGEHPLTETIFSRPLFNPIRMFLATDHCSRDRSSSSQQFYFPLSPFFCRGYSRRFSLIVSRAIRHQSIGLGWSLLFPVLFSKIFAPKRYFFFFFLNKYIFFSYRFARSYRELCVATTRNQIEWQCQRGRELVCLIFLCGFSMIIFLFVLIFLMPEPYPPGDAYYLVMGFGGGPADLRGLRARLSSSCKAASSLQTHGNIEITRSPVSRKIYRRSTQITQIALSSRFITSAVFAIGSMTDSLFFLSHSFFRVLWRDTIYSIHSIKYIIYNILY